MILHPTAATCLMIAAAVCYEVSTAMALSLKSTFSTDSSRSIQKYRSNSIEQVVDLDIEQEYDEREQQHVHIRILDQDCKCDRRRRDVLATLTSSIISLSAGAPAALATATESDSFDAPMNGLTRQIRTGIVKGAQVIDKLDSRWERLSDDFGLGDKRNQPKRNVIDAGGNGRTKRTVQSQSNNGSGAFDGVLAASLLKQCDEVSR